MPPLELPPDALPRGVRSVRSMPGHAGWQPARCCDASDDGLSGVEQPRCALMMRYDFGDVNTVLGGGAFGQARAAAAGACCCGERGRRRARAPALSWQTWR